MDSIFLPFNVCDHSNPFPFSGFFQPYAVVRPEPAFEYCAYYNSIEVT